MICGVFLSLFIYKITLNWIFFGGTDIFILFLGICSEKSAAVLFSLQNCNKWNIFLFDTRLEFPAKIFEAIIYVDWCTRKSKAAKCFYLKIPKLVNLTNWQKKSEIIISLPCKRNLKQDQKKINKTNKTQLKSKQQQQQ